MYTELLGYAEDGTPIWLIAGAEEEDPDDNDENEGEGEDDNDEGEDENDDAPDDDKKHPPSGKKQTNAPAKKTTPAKKATPTWTPPSKAEWERTQAALQKLSSKEKAARTAQLEKARKEGMDEAAAKAREEALKEAENSYVPQILKLYAKDALRDANAKSPSRAVQLIDMSKVDYNGGEPLGLEGEINRLKEDWPELFAAEDDNSNGTKKTAKKAVPAAKVAAADKKDDDKDKKPSGASKIADRLLGVKA